MIIRYPTGQYKDAGQLPETPSDPRSVTFTISNEAPLRPNNIVYQLPISEEEHARPPLIYTDAERRTSYGELVFTTVKANRTSTGSNTKLFATGEFLEFSDETAIPIDQPAIPLSVELQHNTNILDLSNAGLTPEEITSITQQSAVKKKALEDSLAGIQAQILNGQTAVVENQKDVNETRKVLAAVQQVLQPTDPIVLKLQTRETELLAERDSLSTQLNSLNVQATQIYNALINVSVIVT